MLVGLGHLATYLCNVQTAAGTLGVAQHDEDAGLLHSGPDAVHLRALRMHGVRHVFVDESCIAQWRVRPDGPANVLSA